MPVPDYQLAIGKAIRAIRLREGLTQEEFAQDAGLSVPWLSLVESGQKDLQWSSINRIAEGLNVSALELVAVAERIKLDRSGNLESD